jgi:hypothetical protein
MAAFVPLAVVGSVVGAVVVVVVGINENPAAGVSTCVLRARHSACFAAASARYCAIAVLTTADSAVRTADSADSDDFKVTALTELAYGVADISPFAIYPALIK